MRLNHLLRIVVVTLVFSSTFNACSCFSSPARNITRDVTFTGSTTGGLAVFNVYDEDSGLFVKNMETGATTEVVSETVDSYQITPDESQIVYFDDGNLYSVSVTGENQTELAHDVEVDEFSISSDSSAVVYLTGLPEIALYSVPIDGSAEATLLSNNEDITNILSFSISDDSANTVFTAVTDSATLLYSIATTGGELITLSQNTEGDSTLNVSAFDISPDSSTVVFLGDVEVDDVDRLYSVDITGSDVTTLSNNTDDNTLLDVADFEISSDSTTVVFRGDTVTSDLYRIYSVDISGGTVTALSNNVSNPNLDVNDYTIDPTSTYAVYIGDTENDGIKRLYSVALTGGTATRLSNNTEEDSSSDDSMDVEYFDITSDGQTVVYLGDTLNNEQEQIFTVDIAGSESTQVSDDGQNVETDLGQNSFAIVDDAYIVYLADTSDVTAIYSATLDGNDVIQLSSSSAENPIDVINFRPIPETSGVLFEAYQNGGRDENLYEVDLTTTDVIDVLDFD